MTQQPLQHGHSQQQTHPLLPLYCNHAAATQSAALKLQPLQHASFILRQHLNIRAATCVLVFLALLMLLSPYLLCVSALLRNLACWVAWSSSSSSTASLKAARISNIEAQPVPKLLHQTWKNDQVPEKWRAAQASCRAMHPDYTYKLWTDEEAEQLIASRYPWFMHIYQAYPHAIQRADAMRYFILHACGGIYLDLDIVCNSSLDFLRQYNFSAPKTYPIGLSNDVLASQPGDAFALRLTHHLGQWNLRWGIKYATVMLSAGPLYLTVQYALMGAQQRQGVAVLLPELYGKYVKGPDALMTHLHGSSWHGGDALLVRWLERNWVAVVALGVCCAALGLLVLLQWKRHQPCGGTGSTAEAAAPASLTARLLIVKQPSAEL